MFLKKVMSFVTVFLILLSSTCYAESSEHPSFLNEYTFDNTTQTFYKKHNVEVTWQDAVKTCVNEGTTLLTPASEMELEVVERLKSPDFEGMWVGISDLFVSKQFLTLEGHPPEFVPWGGSEPKDSKERCVILDSENEFGNRDCLSLLSFVCTIQLNKLPKNTSNPLCENHDRGYVYHEEGDRCYKFHTKVGTWHEAFTTCKKEDSELVVINSESEADYLTEQMRNIRRFYSPKASYAGRSQSYIGVSDLLVEGLFLTVDGNTPIAAGYEVWNDNSDELNGTEHCVTINHFEGMNLVNCTDTYTFICEKVLKKNAVGAYFNSPYGPKKGEPDE